VSATNDVPSSIVVVPDVSLFSETGVLWALAILIFTIRMIVQVTRFPSLSLFVDRRLDTFGLQFFCAFFFDGEGIVEVVNAFRVVDFRNVGSETFSDFFFRTCVRIGADKVFRGLFVPGRASLLSCPDTLYLFCVVVFDDQVH
jgi:hypothetical protein